jgi:hypothetical protein
LLRNRSAALGDFRCPTRPKFVSSWLMSKKFSAARKDAFLKYLSESGNQTLSAERAKVSRSWVQLHRSTDAEFDAACREAIAVAKMMLRDDAQVQTGPPLPSADIPSADGRRSLEVRSAPPASGRGSGPADPRWRYHDGHELVVSGTNGRRTQVRRAKLSQWTPKVEQRFLAVVMATANVKLACREVGLWPPSAYNHRKRFPGFAKAWDQAVEIGQREVESSLIQNIGYFFDRELPEPEAPMRDVSVMDAIRLLRMYEKRERERRKG